MYQVVGFSKLNPMSSPFIDCVYVIRAGKHADQYAGMVFSFSKDYLVKVKNLTLARILFE